MRVRGCRGSGDVVMSSRPSVPVVLAGPDGPSHPVVRRRPGPVIPALAATITLAITAELGAGVLADVASTEGFLDRL
jgi:hypothetical protein